MNKSPFSTSRGRGRNEHSKPYYRKQQVNWNNKNPTYTSPTNSSSQEEKSVNTSGSSDDYIPFNNSLPSPISNSLPSPSLLSPTSTVSSSSPFYHLQKQGGQFYGQHPRRSFRYNESPSHSPRGRGNFNKSFSPNFNSRPPRGRGPNQYHGNNHYQGRNYQNRNQYHGKKETNINNYIDQSFFEDPWAELMDDWEKTRSVPEDSENLNQSSSTDKFDDSSICQSQEDSLLEDSRNDKESGSDCRDAESQDEEIFAISQDDANPSELKGETSFAEEMTAESPE